jgi:hypothetical protein
MPTTGYISIWLLMGTNFFGHCVLENRIPIKYLLLKSHLSEQITRECVADGINEHLLIVITCQNLI